MTNQELLRIAMQQSAIDSSCQPEDFLLRTNRVVISQADPKARKYLDLPFTCDLTSYGNNVVASVAEPLWDMVSHYIDTYRTPYCFETPSMYVLNDALAAYALRICFMAEYFLPDLSILKPLPCTYKVQLLPPAAFQEYYQPQWQNALCEKRKQLDILAVGAFDAQRLVGLAGCSADCDTMWQIGIDVLPDYRGQGIAAALTSRLAFEILKRGKVPFYCCAWSNIPSARNAIRSGFRPAWVQMTARTQTFVNRANRGISC